MLVHDGPAVDWDDGFRSRRPVSESAVWAPCVAVAAPLLNDDFGFSHRVEYLCVEQFVSETGVEAFAVAVFPRTARQASLRDAERGEPGSI